jgi:hypothetical protein
MTPASYNWRKPVALAVLLGFLPFASACFGSFNLTRKSYQFNKGVSADKWVRWLVFMVMSPIYPLAGLVDMLFANCVEFWSGNNPINARLEPQTVVGPNGEVASLIPVENGARIVITERSGAVHTVTLLREAPGVVAAYDEHGRLASRLVGLGSAEPASSTSPGTLILRGDFRGHPRRTPPASPASRRVARRRANPAARSR